MDPDFQAIFPVFAEPIIFGTISRKIITGGVGINTIVAGAAIQLTQKSRIVALPIPGIIFITAAILRLYTIARTTVTAIVTAAGIVVLAVAITITNPGLVAAAFFSAFICITTKS